MSFFEFIRQPRDKQICWIQRKQASLPIHNTKKNSENNRAQQKQHKQLILTDSKNIFTYGF